MLINSLDPNGACCAGCRDVSSIAMNRGLGKHLNRQRLQVILESHMTSIGTRIRQKNHTSIRLRVNFNFQMQTNPFNRRSVILNNSRCLELVRGRSMGEC